MGDFVIALPLSGTAGGSRFVDLTGKTVVAHNGVENVSASGNSDGIAANFAVNNMAIEVVSPGFPVSGAFSIGVAITPSGWESGTILTVTSGPYIARDSSGNVVFDGSWGSFSLGTAPPGSRATLLVTRDDSDTLRFFNNGVLTDSWSGIPDAVGESWSGFFLGATSGGTYLGLMDDAFVVSGEAVHTSNYTPYLGMPTLGGGGVGEIDATLSGEMLPSGGSYVQADNDPLAPIDIDAVLLGPLKPRTLSSMLVDNPEVSAVQIVGTLSIVSGVITELKIVGQMSMTSERVHNSQVVGLFDFTASLSARVGSYAQSVGVLTLVNAEAVSCGCDHE